MGRKIEASKSKSYEGRKSFEISRELGKRAVDETKRLASMIKALENLDVDDDVKQAAKNVLEGTKADAEKYVRTEVKGKVDEGKKSIENSSDIASEQMSHNEKVMRTFESMDSVGNFGKGARTSSRGNVERSSSEFKKIITDNKSSVQEADKAYEQVLNEISSTF